MLPALTGSQEPVRPYTLHQTMSLALAIRQGDWKYLDHPGSGGNNYEREGEWGMKQFALPELAPTAPGQLYNLKQDPGETRNLYHEHPELVAQLKEVLQSAVQKGRSTPLTR